MPCRIDEQDDDYATKQKAKAKEAKAKDDERKLCEAGSILANLLNNSNAVLDPELKARAERIVEMHYQHREEERQHEVGKIKAEINGLEDSCQRIRKLGGEPGSQLLGEINKKRRLMRSIEEVDRNSPEFWDREKNVF